MEFDSSMFFTILSGLSSLQSDIEAKLGYDPDLDKYNMQEWNYIQSIKDVIHEKLDAHSISVECPNKFDENDLACFWCNHSDECRRDFENENIQSKAE